MAAAMAHAEVSSSSDPPPSLRQQLRLLLDLYRCLTNVYFLLIEQGAASSPATTRTTISQQIRAVYSLLIGEGPPAEASGASRSRTQATRDAGAPSSGQHSHTRPIGLARLPASYREQLASLTLFKGIMGAAQVAQTRSVASSSTAAPSIPFVPTLGQTIEAVEVVDKVLARLMQRAEQHAANQKRIDTLVHRLEGRDGQTVQAIRRLATLRQRCHRLVQLASEEERVIQKAESHPLQFDEILRYARTLSQFTTAPPGFKLKTLEADQEQHEAQEGKKEGEEDGEAPPKRKKLYQVASGEGGDAAGSDGQIPAHLQDKLPFPSVDAIRRGASEVKPPTWAMFQQGIVQVDQVGQAEGADTMETDTGMPIPEHHAPVSQTTRPSVKRPAPVEEEEEGFGLDLN